MKMSDVVSLDLSRELYELSGWDGTEKYWVPEAITNDGPIDHGQIMITDNWFPMSMPKGSEIGIPAYPLGYLLRKLPGHIQAESKTLWLTIYNSNYWWAGYNNAPFERHQNNADTPEDCVAKLCIKLIKQGVLK